MIRHDHEFIHAHTRVVPGNLLPLPRYFFTHLRRV
jgi:hypothetical protein